MNDGFTLNFIEISPSPQREIDDCQSNKADFGLSIMYDRMAMAYGGNDYSNPETYNESYEQQARIADCIQYQISDF